MTSAARLQGITSAAAGDAVVLETELQRKLGRAAWHVWTVLIARRDPGGETHITGRGILRARGFARNVRQTSELDRALRRLETAALVTPVGRVFRAVPSRTGVVERQVYVRNIWGARLLRLSPSAPAECAVPIATKVWIATASTWGGARPGAGRRGGSSSEFVRMIRGLVRSRLTAYRAVDLKGIEHYGLDIEGIAAHVGPRPFKGAELDHIRPLSSFDLTVDAEVRECFAPENHQWLTREENKVKAKKESRQGSDRKRAGNSTPGSDRAPAPIQLRVPIEITQHSEVNTRGGTFLPSGEKLHAAASAANPSPIREESTEVGTVFAGTATARGVGLAAPIAGVPLYPGHAIVKPAFVPEAPLLDLESTDEVRATALARAYRAAIEKRFGRQRRPILARGDIRRSKHYPNLQAFARELIDHEIAPAAWCIHRIDRWRRATKDTSRPSQPSLAWVYNLKAISDDNRWQFRVEYESGKLGGRAVFSKTHLKLLAIYGRMRADLTRMKKADAVAKHFPDGLYEELVDQARRDAAETRYRLETDIARGRHVW